MIFQSNSSDIERLKIQHQIQVDVAEKEIAALKAEVNGLKERLAIANHFLKDLSLPTTEEIKEALAKHKKEGEA